MRNKFCNTTIYILKITKKNVLERRGFNGNIRIFFWCFYFRLFIRLRPKTIISIFLVFLYATSRVFSLEKHRRYILESGFLLGCIFYTRRSTIRNDINSIEPCNSYVVLGIVCDICEFVNIHTL